tara:strand:- start:689 stop:973 length:285 start_codon:yes stop_codon:yes gene_type:complete
MAIRWQVKRDTEAKWTLNNPVLAEGEIGIDKQTINTNNVLFKIGDGITAWDNLLYVNISLSNQSLPVYADDISAGSLSSGDWYTTPTGEIRIKL